MTELPDLDGKLIGLVPSRMPSGAMIVLEGAKLETVAGRLFVTGQVPTNDPGNWVRGVPGAVAWDLVGYYVVFKSFEDYRKRYGEDSSAWDRFWRRVFAWMHGGS